jgi:hypothetical protein
MHREFPELHVGDKPEQQAADGDDYAAHQQSASVDSLKGGLTQVGQNKVCLATAVFGGGRLLRENSAGQAEKNKKSNSDSE